MNIKTYGFLMSLLICLSAYGADENPQNRPMRSEETILAEANAILYSEPEPFPVRNYGRRRVTDEPNVAPLMREAHNAGNYALETNLGIMQDDARRNRSREARQRAGITARRRLVFGQNAAVAPTHPLADDDAPATQNQNTPQ